MYEVSEGNITPAVFFHPWAMASKEPQEKP